MVQDADPLLVISLCSTDGEDEAFWQKVLRRFIVPHNDTLVHRIISSCFGHYCMKEFRPCALNVELQYISD